MKEKSTFELCNRLNQIRVEVQKLWIEHNQIIEELHNRLPHLKNEPDLQPKKRVRKYEMKYFYEIKYKNGRINGGHNLENIITKDNIILLKGVDIIPTYYDEEYHYWTIKIDMNEIEYLKIEQMTNESVE